MTATATSLWQARYRNADQADLLIHNPVIETLLAHRSVRAYRDEPLAEGILETLLAAAQSAATSSNLQAWSLVAVTDPARRARLCELSGGQLHIAQAPLVLVWLADYARIQRQAEKQGIELDALNYLDSTLVGSIDATLAAQNAVIAAESLGLGAVYLGSLRNNLQGVIDELQLPSRVYPVFGLALGYPDPQRPAAVKPRLPQALVLHRETYQVPEQEAALIHEYDQHLGNFYREQGLASPDWSSHVMGRLQSIESLHTGRAAIAEVIKQQGFSLR